MPDLDDDVAEVLVGFGGGDGRRGYWLTTDSRGRRFDPDEAPDEAPPPPLGPAVHGPTQPKEDGHVRRNTGARPSERRSKGGAPAQEAPHDAPQHAAAR